MRNLLLRSLGCMLMSVMFNAIHAQSTATTPQDKGWNKDLLVAKWKTGDLIFDLKKGGAAMVTVSGRECPGTWTVKNGKVNITPTRLRWKNGDPCSQPRTLDVTRVSANGMDVIADPTTEQEIHLVKVQ